MPWTPGDATKHTKRAATPTLKKTWANVANSAYHRHGDDGRAIRTANSVVGRADSARKRGILSKQAESDSNAGAGNSPPPPTDDNENDNGEQ